MSSLIWIHWLQEVQVQYISSHLFSRLGEAWHSLSKLEKALGQLVPTRTEYLGHLCIIWSRHSYDFRLLTSYPLDVWSRPLFQVIQLGKSWQRATGSRLTQNLWICHWDDPAWSGHLLFVQTAQSAAWIDLQSSEYRSLWARAQERPEQRLLYKVGSSQWSWMVLVLVSFQSGNHTWPSIARQWLELWSPARLFISDSEFAFPLKYLHLAVK